MRRAVITGLGLVAPGIRFRGPGSLGTSATPERGDSAEEFADACFSGRGGLRETTLFPADGLSTAIFGEVEGLPAGRGRFPAMLRGAAEGMLRSAGVTDEDVASWGSRCRLFLGTLLTDAVEAFYRRSLARQEGRDGAEQAAGLHDYSSYAKKVLGVRGAVNVISTACASGTTAAGMALDYIRHGICDAAVAGGADPLTYTEAAGFNALRAMSKDTCNPFDEARDGISIGEGAAFFLFESLEHAKARGANILCEAAGYATGNDAYHITALAPGGEGAFHVMEEALRDAGIAPADVDYINAHGTGTKVNDREEATAMGRLFGGAGEVDMSSTKALIGHAMGASGAIELASVILSMQRGQSLPMPHLERPIPMAGNIRVSASSHPIRIRCAMSNSFAFGGNMASFLVKQYEGGGDA